MIGLNRSPPRKSLRVGRENQRKNFTFRFDSPILSLPLKLHPRNLMHGRPIRWHDYMVDAQRYFLRLSVLSALALHGTPIRWHDIHGQRTTLLPLAQRALRTCTGQQDHRAAFPFTSASIPSRTALRFLYSASDAICEGRSPLLTS